MVAVARASLIRVEGPVGGERARREARRVAVSLGFDREDVERITLAAMELASNLVRYAVSGQMTIGPTRGGFGMEIESRDDGPGIADVPRALRDGHTTGGGLGSGLAGIGRLMDELHISSTPAGTVITCRKWLERAIGIGAAGRPLRAAEPNGDAWRTDRSGALCRIVVVDGLGHGSHAAAAASAALDAVPADARVGPLDVMQACHAAMRRTRGAAVAVAVVDGRTQSMQWVGVGNVGAAIWVGERRRSLSSQRGIVGSHLPPLRAESVALGEKWLVAIHTDGVRSAMHSELPIPPRISIRTPQRLADAIVGGWARSTDDAGVVVCLPLSKSRAAR